VTAYRFMRENRDRYTARETVGLFGASSSTYYRWAKYGVSGRRRESGAELAGLIWEIFLKHRYWYGSPRVRETLRRDYGKRASRKKATALMRKHGLNARGKRNFVRTTDFRHGLPVCPHILSRQFHAAEAGEKWVSDITYLRTVGRWVYLTVVLDLYDRKVIGWALSGDREAGHTTIPPLELAFANREAREGLVFHSDRGV
jgi:transposase InsO family protein